MHSCYFCMVHPGVILGLRGMLNGMRNVDTIASKWFEFGAPHWRPTSFLTRNSCFDCGVVLFGSRQHIAAYSMTVPLLVDRTAPSPLSDASVVRMNLSPCLGLSRIGGESGHS